MTRSQRLVSRIREFFADDEDDMGGRCSSALTPQDTIIQNQKEGGRFPVCPTCSHTLVPGFIQASVIQCPGCQTDVNLATGNVQYTTKAPNMSRGHYATF